MTFRRILGGVIAMVMTLGVGAAHAATMYFGTGNGVWDWNSYKFLESGVTITVPFANHPFGGAIIQDSDGLGIISSDCEGGIGSGCVFDNSFDVDGYKLGEALVLTADANIQIDAVLFSHVDEADFFSYSLDGNSWSNDELIGFDERHVFNSLLLAGDTFSLGAFKGKSNWLLRGVEFTPVSAVPLPPAIFAFGAALLGMGWLKRRKRGC